MESKEELEGVDVANAGDPKEDDQLMGGHRYCPKCKQDTKTEEIKVSETDTEAFMRCVLGNTVFRKEYSITDDISIVFKDMTALDVDNMLVQINELDPLDPYTIRSMTRLKFCYSCDRLTIGKNVIESMDIQVISKLKAKELLTKYDETFGNVCSNMLMTQFHNLCNHFGSVASQLAKNVLSKDFWKGVGPV